MLDVKTIYKLNSASDAQFWLRQTRESAAHALSMVQAGNDPQGRWAEVLGESNRRIAGLEAFLAGTEPPDAVRVNTRPSSASSTAAGAAARQEAESLEAQARANLEALQAQRMADEMVALHARITGRELVDGQRDREPTEPRTEEELAARMLTLAGLTR